MVEGLEFYYNHKEQDNLLLGQESETNYQIPGESKDYNINIIMDTYFKSPTLHQQSNISSTWADE